MTTVPPRQPSQWVHETILLAAVVIASWHFVHLRYLLNQEFPLATLSSFLDGTAYKPFQFRMLVPLLVGGLERIGIADELTLYRFVDVLAVIGIYYSFRLYLSGFISREVAGFMAFGVFYALPWNYLLARDIPILLPYDLASVALMTLALAFLHRRNWPWFYVVFALGVLNRETMFFTALAFALVEFGKRSRTSLAVHLAVQIAIWFAVKTTMGSIYSGNPGAAFEYYHVGTETPHWRTNLNVLVTGPHLLLFLSNFGFAWVIVLAGWRHLQDQFLRSTLWIIPPYVFMVLLAGNANEIRVFGELLPVIMAPAVVILVSLSSRAIPKPGRAN